MAEGPDPFIKLQEQVSCPVCLDVFTQPKLLVCNHAFCKQCIDHLPVDVDEGNHIIKCPTCTCREKTTLPKHDAANLPPAFYITTLIELYQATQKATAAVPDTPKDESCSKHGRPLDMYCDDCQQVVCAKCFHLDHRDHKCDFVADTYSETKQEISDRLLIVQQQVGVVLDALDKLNTQEREIIQHGESVKNQIDTLIGEIVEAAQQSGRQLKENVDNLVQQKLSNISGQKEHGKMLLTQFKSCQEYVEDKLDNKSQQEILHMIEILRAVSQELELQELQMKEKADIVFQRNHDILERCSKIGEVSTTINNSLYEPLKNLDSKVAIVGMHRTININVPNVSWKDFFLSTLTCNLIRDEDNLLLKCKIQHIKGTLYKIEFAPACPGLYCIEVQINIHVIPVLSK